VQLKGKEIQNHDKLKQIQISLLQITITTNTLVRGNVERNTKGLERNTEISQSFVSFYTK